MYRYTAAQEPQINEQTLTIAALRFSPELLQEHALRRAGGFF